LEKLVGLVDYLKGECQLPIEYVSGGNSSSLKLLYDGLIPPGINHLRIGEGILLGRETLTGSYLPDLYHDAFIVEAEVIQAQYKPAVPDGEVGLDAFGRVPSISVKEPGIRLLLNLGHQGP
jgi:predicted amino acid racemase